MAAKPVRKRVAVIAGAFAVSALLAGPALTWGLDVPVGTSSGTVTQVAGTTQGTVDAVQQTVDSTVTTVQSTAQTAPAAQPVVQQVQSAAGAVGSTPAAQAPARTMAAPAPRVTPNRSAAAPTVKRSAGAVARIRTSVPGAERAAGSTAGASVARAARRGGARRSGDAARHPGGVQSANSAPTSAPALDCALPSPLAALPGAASLDALLGIVCNAGGPLVPEIFAPARIGTTQNAAPLATVANVLGAAATGVLRAHHLGLRVPALQTLLAYAQRPPARASAASPASGVAGGGAQRTAGGATAAGIRLAAAPQIARAAAASSAPTSAVAHAHHGIFSGRVDGTQALSLVLLIDLSLLGALVLWRLAQRWVVPRFI